MLGSMCASPGAMARAGASHGCCSLGTGCSHTGTTDRVSSLPQALRDIVIGVLHQLKSQLY